MGVWPILLLICTNFVPRRQSVTMDVKLIHMAVQLTHLAFRGGSMRVLLMVLLVFSTSTYGEDIKVLFHLSEKMKGLALINSVNNYFHSNPESKVFIVINNTGVLRVARDGGLSEDFQTLIESGIEIGVCNNAIIAKKVDPKHIVPGMTILKEGGISKIVQLQRDGFLYIKI